MISSSRRIALVSDIHGNLPALDAVIADFTRRGVIEVVNLGDSLSGPLLPRETAERLMATDWFHLAGNHERQILAHGPAGRGASDVHARACLTAAQLAWIAEQKPVAAYDEGIHFCHGSPRSDLEYFLESVDAAGGRPASADEIRERLGAIDTALVACGHTHVPRSVRCGATTIVNPGSVGVPAYDDEHPYRHAVENHSPDARYAIVERGAQGWITTLIAVPYDFEPMARLAERNGRPEWAHALRTGTMPPRTPAWRVECGIGR